MIAKMGKYFFPILEAIRERLFVKHLCSNMSQ